MDVRQLRGWVMAVVFPAATGCYKYVPLDTSGGIPVGERIAVEITDRGRSELGDRIGSGVLRIEGTVTRSDSQDVFMNVWSVAQIGGVTSRWSGESVQFRRTFVAGVSTRTLNRSRTYLVAAAATVGVLLFAQSQDLFGSSVGGGGPDPDPGPISSRAWPF